MALFLVWANIVELVGCLFILAASAYKMGKIDGRMGELANILLSS